VTAAEFFAALPSRFNPAAAVGVAAIIQFELTGDGGGTWHAVIADGACEVAAGAHPEPTLVVLASAENWLKVVSGSLDPQMAFLTGRLKVRGDMGLAMRLRALFL
jgi:putative sterol carrier protein